MMAFDMAHDADDATLLSAMVAGDRAAARVLTARLGPKVYAHAFRLLAHRAEAEDITQEALMRLWKIAPHWDADKGRVTTWLYTVVANLCRDVLRKRGRISTGDIPDIADTTPSPADAMQSTARAAALQQALSQLPERQRQAVVLRHIEGLSNPEIAQIMDLSVDAVESLTARGKRALAKHLIPQRDALEVWI